LGLDPVVACLRTRKTPRRARLWCRRRRGVWCRRRRRGDQCRAAADGDPLAAHHFVQETLAAVAGWVREVPQAVGVDVKRTARSHHRAVVKPIVAHGSIGRRNTRHEVTGPAEPVAAGVGSRAPVLGTDEDLHDDGVVLCDPVAVAVASAVLANFVVWAAAPAQALGVEEARLVGGPFVGVCELAPAGYLGARGVPVE